MADGNFPTLVSATRDANTSGNPMFVSAAISNASIAVTATDLDIRDLTHVSDSVKVGDGTDFLAVAADGSIAVTDNGGSLTVDGSVSITGSVTVTATDLDIRDLNSATDSVTVVATNLDIRDLSSATDSVAVTDGGGSLTVDGTVAATQSGTWDIGTVTSITNAVTVTATDLDVRDLSHAQDSVKVGDGTDFLAVNGDGSINVVVASSSGTKVHDHKLASAVAADTTDNHDYTASGGVLLIKQVSFASSGGSKAVLIYDPTGTNKTIWTGFIPKDGGEKALILQLPFEVADTKVIRLAVTNRQGAAQDLYSMIEAEQL